MAGQVNCKGDIIVLYKFEPNDNHWRGYEILKVKIYRQKGYKEWDWVFLMIVDDDKYPIALTDVYASHLLDNPNEAKSFAYNIWMDRHR